MLSFRPQTDRLSLAWSGDSAFEVDRFLVEKKWTDESWKAWAQAWTVASEQLAYDPLIKAGDRPTYFHFQPLGEVHRRHLRDRFRNDDAGAVLWMVVVRLCLIDVDGWDKLIAGGAPKLADRRVDPLFPELGPILAPAVIEWIAGLGDVVHGTRPMATLIDELGRNVVARSGPSGK